MSMVGDGCGFATLEVGLSYMLVTILLTYSPVTRVGPYPPACQAGGVDFHVGVLVFRQESEINAGIIPLVVLFERD